MRPDYAIAIYGYLPAAKNPPQLAYEDDPEFDTDKDNMFTDLSDEPMWGALVMVGCVSHGGAC